jgi:hypothetical protein
MEVPTRGVDAKRPARARDLLPGRESQRILEEPSHGLVVERSRLDVPDDERGFVAG